MTIAAQSLTGCFVGLYSTIFLYNIVFMCLIRLNPVHAMYVCRKPIFGELFLTQRNSWRIQKKQLECLYMTFYYNRIDSMAVITSQTDRVAFDFIILV